MPRLRPIRTLAAVLVLCALLWLTLIAGPMWLTRWRFQRLLADFHSIYPTQSTWADAQRLMSRWGKFGHYDGSCTAQSCDYTIIVEDPISAFARHSSESVDDRLFRLHVFSCAERLGWRGALFSVDFRVRDGVIRHASTGFILQVPGFVNGQSEYPLSLELETEVRDRLGFGSWESHRDQRPVRGIDEQLTYHPDWKVGRPGGCKPSCEIGSLTYTPVLPQAELVRLTSYDFSCLTRLRPCSEFSDIVAAARDWHLYDGTVGIPGAPTRTSTQPTSCQADLRALGRDAEIILEVDPLSNKQTEDQLELATARLVRVIKGSIHAQPGSNLLISPFGPSTYSLEPTLPEHLIPGHHSFVLLNSEDRYENGGLVGPRCGVLDATPENLRALTLGIAEDQKYRDLDDPTD